MQSEFLKTQHHVCTEFVCMKIVPFEALYSNERISMVFPFISDSCGFRLAILWDSSIPMWTSDPAIGFQLHAGLMQLSGVHTAGINREVVQHRRNCLKQLQRSEILAFTIILLCSVTSWCLGLSPVSRVCCVAQLMSAYHFRTLAKHPWCLHFVEINYVWC